MTPTYKDERAFTNVLTFMDDHPGVSRVVVEARVGPGSYKQIGSFEVRGERGTAAPVVHRVMEIARDHFRGSRIHMPRFRVKSYSGHGSGNVHCRRLSFGLSGMPRAPSGDRLPAETYASLAALRPGEWADGKFAQGRVVHSAFNPNGTVDMRLNTDKKDGAKVRLDDSVVLVPRKVFNAAVEAAEELERAYFDLLRKRAPPDVTGFGGTLQFAHWLRPEMKLEAKIALWLKHAPDTSNFHPWCVAQGLSK